MRNVCVLLAAIAIALAPALQTNACMHAPRDYKGSVGSSAQEAIAFFKDGKEELILKVNYKTSGEGPSSFAWVVTVPNEPDAYAVAEGPLFEDVFTWANGLLEIPANSREVDGADQTNSLGVELGKQVKVGPYDIQPVRGKGKDAVVGLNGWFEKNGFAAIGAQELAYFAEHNFTFLCVKVVPGKDQKALSGSGDLPPLQVSFKTEKLYYPLKLSSSAGELELNLYTLTAKEFDFEGSGDALKKVGWGSRYADHLQHNVKVNAADFPKTLKQAFVKSAFKDEPGGGWFLNQIHVHGVNKSKELANWKEDLFFKVKS
ncbi:MAG: DUF2330 domain-containing protein [Planctomycetes bacterium]|nr:DUF2330 domain-containing protein [Planctomycetota bacterium]